ILRIKFILSRNLGIVLRLKFMDSVRERDLGLGHLMGEGAEGEAAGPLMRNDGRRAEASARFGAVPVALSRSYQLLNLFPPTRICSLEVRQRPHISKLEVQSRI